MIATIADDFSGATEIAGIAWRLGLTAEIVLFPSLPRRERSTPSNHVLVVDTDSRLRGAHEAARRAGLVAVRLRELNPEWVYKKVDSVLRGHVIGEIHAVVGRLGIRDCVLVPANPRAGRVIKQGKYFIDGKKITQTDFRNDPVYPRRSDLVVDLVDSGVRGREGNPGRSLPVAVSDWSAARLPRGVVMGQAANVSDLRRWARRVDSTILPAGGGEFFEALLRDRLAGEIKSRQPPRPTRAEPTLVVSGSTAEASRDFREQCRRNKWPVLSMPMELISGAGTPEYSRPRQKARAAWVLAICDALRHHPCVLVNVGPPFLPGKRQGIRVGGILAEVVLQVLRRVEPRRVCLEGGATAAQVLAKLEYRRMVVEHEVATGVTAVRSWTGGSPQFVVKPGSYLWPRGLLTD